MSIEVSFIIPCLNSEKTLQATLESIQDLCFDHVKLEIIVVDNGSEDRTIQIARSNQVTVEVCPKKGAGAARNHGARRARGRFLAFIDSDTVLHPQWLSVLYQHLSENHYSAALGRVIPSGEEGFLTSFRKKNAEVRYHGTNISLYHFNGISPVINTAACIYEKNTFMAIGGFDERLGRLEDTEMSYRLFNYGGTIFASKEAIAYVYNTGNLTDYFKRSFYCGRVKRDVSSLVHSDFNYVLRSLVMEFFGPHLRSFSLRDLIFYYLNLMASYAGMLSRLHCPPLKPAILTPRLTQKLLALLDLRLNNEHYELTLSGRLIVVDSLLYFYSMERSDWFTIDRAAPTEELVNRVRMAVEHSLLR